MAEMTAAEVVAWLTDDKAFGQECYSRKQIAALIEQQAREIERQTKAIGIFMSANQSPETYRQVKAALEEKP